MEHKRYWEGHGFTTCEKMPRNLNLKGHGFSRDGLVRTKTRALAPEGTVRVGSM